METSRGQLTGRRPAQNGGAQFSETFARRGEWNGEAANTIGQ